MSLPAASPPIAVLVLAWDEAAPAVRVLVEAAEISDPDLDSVIVLVPAGPATDELTPEEFLPLEASLDLLLPEPPQPTAVPLLEAAATAVPKADVSDAPLPIPESAAPAAANPTGIPSGSGAAPSLPATAAEALVKPALIWQEVRVLRYATPSPTNLATYSGQVEPTLVWTGTASAPAAPYLGSAEPAPAPQGNPATSIPPVAAALLAATETAASALTTLQAPAPAAVNPLPPAGAETAPPPAYPLEEVTAAPDADADAMPTPATDEPVPPSAASTTELSQEAAAPEAPFAVDTTPVQAAEPATPVPIAPAADEANSLQLTALRPTGQPFDAPDLNFQVIQYARRAVPQALAEQPFAVIYAPAWPTWLAAQELRNSSGQPLVLHLAQLAAADDELIDLATGWVAEIQRQALHRADLILTETPALAARLRHELALPAHRVRAVPATDADAVAQALRTARRQ